jgi:MFS family permease
LPNDETLLSYNSGDGSMTIGGSGDSAEFLDPKTLISGYVWLTESVSWQRVATARGFGELQVKEVKAWDPAFQGKFFNFVGEEPKNSDEALVNLATLKRTGLSVGDQLELPELKRKLTIVGTIEDAKAQRNESVIFTLPGAITKESNTAETYYLAGDKPITWDQVKELNLKGIGVLSAQVLHNPPAHDEVPYYTLGGLERDNSVLSKLPLLILFPLVLFPIGVLAGSAFSFGTRRQAASLAVASSVGARRATLRQFTIANGLWLGLLAGVIGSTFGSISAAIAMPWLTDGSVVGYPGLHFPWLLLVLIVGTGALIGAIFSFIPSIRAAKVDVLSTLRGTKRDAKIRKRSGIGSLIVILIGAVGLTLSVAAKPIVDAQVDSGVMTSLEGSHWVSTLEFISIGSALMLIIGLLIGSSWLLALSRWISRRLTLASRFATNDLVYNRKRFTSVISSVLATSFIAATVLGMFYTIVIYTKSQYIAYGEVNQLSFDSGYSEDKLDTMAKVEQYYKKQEKTLKQNIVDAQSVAPTKSAALINRHDAAYRHGYGQDATGMPIIGAEGLQPFVVIDYKYLCPNMTSSPGYKATMAAQAKGDYNTVEKIADQEQYKDCYRLVASSAGEFNVANAEEFRALIGGRVDSVAEAALNAGQAVVFHKGLLKDGKLEMQWQPSGLDPVFIGEPLVNFMGEPVIGSDGKPYKVGKPSKTMQVPAVLSHSDNINLKVVIPPQLADKWGIDYRPLLAVINYENTLTTDQKDALSVAFPQGYQLEEGFLIQSEPVSWIIALIAAFFVLASTTIALGLAQIESRADQTTLWSVGSPHGFRVRVIAFQAFVLSSLGTVLGSVVGFALSWALLANLAPRAIFQIPVPQTLTLVIGVPILAALIFVVGIRRRAKFAARLSLD